MKLVARNREKAYSLILDNPFIMSGMSAGQRSAIAIDFIRAVKEGSVGGRYWTPEGHAMRWDIAQ